MNRRSTRQQLLPLWKLCTYQLPFKKIYPSLLNLCLTSLLFLGGFFIIIFLATHSLVISLWKTSLIYIINALYTLIVLQMRGMEPRLTQTLIGTCAVQGFIVALMVVPYVLLMNILPELQSLFYYYLGLGVALALIIVASLWIFMMVTSIYEQALETTTNRALWLVLILYTLQAIVFSLLFF